MNVPRHTRELNASLIQPSQVPTLFQLAANSCARHIELFGTLEGLPFEPFGEAILAAFVDQQHQLSAWQRQVGILVFAESYGYHHHYHDHLHRSQQPQEHPFSRSPGLVFSGLSHLSSLSELLLLPSFAECLVHLDLSSSRASSQVSLSDHDLVALAGMKQLRVLSLAGQQGVGDLGLGHLISSTEFGVGLEKLEYLNMQHTGLTDQGLARLWRPMPKEPIQQQHGTGMGRFIWQYLLGIDLSGTHVHLEVAQALFTKASGCREGSSLVAAAAAPWRKLPADTILFRPLHIQDGQGTNVQSRKVYLEPCPTDPVNGEQLHHYPPPPSLSAWAETLDAAHEKYSWVNIGTSDQGEHRVSVADGLPALMALLKMSSTHVQELPDDPPLPLYSSRAEDHHRWKRQRRRGGGRRREREDRVILGQQLFAREPRVVSSERGISPGRNSSIHKKNVLTGKQGVASLIFVRDRASVRELLTRVERDQGHYGGVHENDDEGSIWASQATLVNHPTQQTPVMSQSHVASAQHMARIRRLHHHNGSSPIMAGFQSDTDPQQLEESLVPLHVAARKELQPPPAPRRKKRVWVPTMGDSRSTFGRSDGATATSLTSPSLSPFVKVVKQEISPTGDSLMQDGDGLFAKISGDRERDVPSVLAPNSPSSASSTSYHSKQAVGQEGGTKEWMTALTTSRSKSKKRKGISGTGSGNGEGHSSNLLAMWVKKEGQQTPSLATCVDSPIKKDTKREESPALSSSSTEKILQEFHFIADERKEKSQVSLTRWLGAGRSLDGQDMDGRGRSAGAHADLLPTTLWMRKVHEESMTLSRNLSMSKKDARASIRQVLPGGVKVQAPLMDAFESDNGE
ncbi:hypothetical protein BGZ73_006335 [Actinomortierella ambigua]|nr:hypothetical protein BGZ73_006335 [Actinomortierella ambigua]